MKKIASIEHIATKLTIHKSREAAAQVKNSFPLAL